MSLPKPLEYNNQHTLNLSESCPVQPDHLNVFAEGYHLMPISELKTFLAKEGHLPGIPSACQVEVQGGFEVGDMQKRMMETIEHQTLYIIQLEDRLARMEQRMNELEAAR